MKIPQIKLTRTHLQTLFSGQPLRVNLPPAPKGASTRQLQVVLAAPITADFTDLTSGKGRSTKRK